MQHIIDIYNKQLIYIFTKKQCIDLKENYLVIIKDECEVIEIDDCLIMHYQERFESLLKMSLPTKMRKTKQLLSYQESFNLIDKMEYGVLSFQQADLPYSIGINHIIMNGHIYFHCAQKGFKLKGINQRATFLVIEDLGINLKVGTHNHQSVVVFGTLKRVDDHLIKKEALLKLIEKLAPEHPYNDQMLTFTNILELEIDYIIGKVHIR